MTFRLLVIQGSDTKPAALHRFMARRFERVRLVVETSHQLARWETEHRKDADVVGTMRRVSEALAQPI